jgi:excisionase family DNA binding protein
MKCKKKLMTAPMVARICECDLKTIHNWVNKGEIDAARTPGRHLRFTRDSVVAFLRKHGFSIPEELAEVEA